MTHGRFNFRDGAAGRVARVVGAANECLHLTTTCAATVRTDSILSSFKEFRDPTTPSDHRAGTPDALIDPGIDLAHPSMLPTPRRKLAAEVSRGDGDGGRGVGRTRGCPSRGPPAYRKGQFPFLTRGAKRPLARARLALPSRDGLAMANSLPREPKMLRRQGLRS